MYKKLAFVMSFVLLLIIGSTSVAATYYVSPSGNDNNLGTSPATAWKTIAKVNSVTFAAGDSILFEGGQTFTAGPEYHTVGTLTVRGGLFFTSGGTQASPITVSSYGTGRATLHNPYMGTARWTDTSSGFTLYECAGFNINNLIFTGAGNTGNLWQANTGILLRAESNYGFKHKHVYIDNVEITDYVGFGILGCTYPDTYDGWEDVRITNSVFHNIGHTGINTEGPWPVSGLTFKDFYIADCQFYNIQGFGGGDGTDATGANGVVLGGVDGGLIEFCQSWNQGGNWAGLHLWQWESENLLWQFNEGYDHWTVGPDGGMMDCDGGSAFSTYQYNYSHDNEGQGMMACAYTRGNDVHDCIFRYNISANDCLGNNLGAATFYTDSSMYNVDVYNNTFVTGRDAVPGSSIVAIWYWKKAGYANINLRNNIFMAEASNKLIHYMTLKGFTFQDNIYWQSGEPLVIEKDGGLVYSSLAAWRTATGQEMLNGNPVGIQIGPQLVDVHAHPILGPHNLANLTGYKLKSVSQCRDAGLDLQALFGKNPGTRDYYGISIPQTSLFDIGAHEYPGGGSAPAPDSTPPAAPTGLTAASTGASINLDWANNGEADISHYSVKRSTTPGGPYTQLISNLNASAYSDKLLTPATYYYVVTATDTSSNQSGNSNQASATVTYPGSIFFSDGFESGNFTAGGWLYGGSDPAVNGSAAYTGSFGASLGKKCWMEKHFSTEGLTDIRVRYMRRHIGDWSLAVSVKYDTGEHVRLIERIEGDLPWHQIDVILPPKADNKPNLVIRFATDSPGPSGVYGYVDNVEIWGIGGGAPDTTPPSPNPMTWATAPYATGSTSIAMVATTATDTSGVEYFFDCTTTGGHDSAWQSGTNYTDTGLTPGTQYCYRVQARDLSPNHNTTSWSSTLCASTTAPDTTPPSPNPMTWSVVPYAPSSSSVSMTATTATDTSGVEYYFDETSGNLGGTDSGWQSGTTYTDSGLSAGTQYCYRVQARDLSPNQNATTWSTTQCATTQTSGDTTPPTPNPMTWATVPYATGTTSIAMVATTATDASGVQYYFDCTSGAGHDSGWQSGTSYTDTGLSPNTQYCYRVQARDLSPNQNATTWSTTLCATTQSGGGGTIFFDGFTDGDLVGWTTSGAVSVKSTGGVVGNYASLQATAWMEKAVSTAGYTSIHVKYYRWVASCNLYVEWWDGSSWNVLETSGSSGWIYMDMTCGSGANNNANFKLRFRTDGTRNNHSAKVDEIEITGAQ